MDCLGIVITPNPTYNPSYLFMFGHFLVDFFGDPWIGKYTVRHMDPSWDRESLQLQSVSFCDVDVEIPAVRVQK